MSKRLGPRPNLTHLRKQAKDLLTAFRSGNEDAAQRFQQTSPWLQTKPPALHDAQSVIAREYGFPSWPQLVRHVQICETIEAARTGDGRKLLRLLKTDPGLATAANPEDRITPLREAAAAGNAEIVGVLLERGADPNALDIGDNASPLHYAAERGRLDVVKLLVEAGANINWMGDVHELGPLGWATFFGPVQRDVADYLIEKGARIGMFPAIALGRADDVRRIAREDPAALDRRSSECDGRKSPIEFAARKKRFDIARLLADLGAEVGIVEAAALGDVAALLTRLKERTTGADLNRALIAAVGAGQTATADPLLEAGADPNCGEEETVMFDAILAADRPMAELLLRHGADLERRDDHWNSPPLGWAVFFGQVEGCRLALDLGAQIEPSMIELARSGERGELRTWSGGTPESFRTIEQMLIQALEPGTQKAR